MIGQITGHENIPGEVAQRHLTKRLKGQLLQIFRRSMSLGISVYVYDDNKADRTYKSLVLGN